MKKQWVIALGAVAVLQGCAAPQRGAIPVVEAGAPVSVRGGGAPYRAPSATTPMTGMASAPADSGVVVGVPQGSVAPIQAFPVTSAAPLAAESSVPAEWSSAPLPVEPSQPTGIPSQSALAPDEQLDGPVLALLTTAKQQQGSGDLGGAASSLERALRIAPREPQVLYRLAEVRLEQGNPAQAEQLSRRALSYAGTRPALQASLWDLIAQSRERMGDMAGAAQARQRAKVTL